MIPLCLTKIDIPLTIYAYKVVANFNKKFLQILVLILLYITVKENAIAFSFTVIFTGYNNVRYTK